MNKRSLPNPPTQTTKTYKTGQSQSYTDRIIDVIIIEELTLEVFRHQRLEHLGMWRHLNEHADYELITSNDTQRLWNAILVFYWGEMLEWKSWKHGVILSIGQWFWVSISSVLFINIGRPWYPPIYRASIVSYTSDNIVDICWTRSIFKTMLKR